MAVDVNNMLHLYASMLYERRILIVCSKLSTVSRQSWDGLFNYFILIERCIRKMKDNFRKRNQPQSPQHVIFVNYSCFFTVPVHVSLILIASQSIINSFPFGLVMNTLHIFTYSSIIVIFYMSVSYSIVLICHYLLNLFFSWWPFRLFVVSSFSR